MSSKLKRVPVTPATPAAPVDHLADLRKWLAERNLRILPIAVGKVTGSPANILDVMYPTHEPNWTLVAEQHDTNTSSGG